MEARPCPVVEFFNGTKQMLVPLFQRSYEWSEKNWQTLWDDLLEQYERGEEGSVASHFTGAIVTAPARSVPIGVSKFLVIDGQQRLTTVAILLCAIRTKLEPDTGPYKKLGALLVNEHDSGLDHFKLLPTQPDREAFQALLAGSPIPGTKFTEALEYFCQKLQGTDSDGSAIDIDRLINSVRERLTVVAIHLGDTDDPYLIFESLNAKGAPLTQADLIRNYLLLRVHSNAQQRAYEEAWLPMQARLPGDHLTEFMRQYLMLTGEEVAKSNIYSVLKRRLMSVVDASIPQELQRMEAASISYARIVGLSAVQEPEIQDRLVRLRRWDIATANPFILKILEAHTSGSMTASEVAACLQIVESFAVRRGVCNVPTNQLKRIFLSVTREMPTSNVVDWLSKTLALGSVGRRWPKDEEFREGLLRYRAYAQPDRCKFLLETLEAHHGHKERTDADGATIEHVMPRTLSTEWRTMLGPGADEIHERWLDVLGNLTLTGYNSELSNSAFSKKRQLLATSHFELNRWICSRETWTQAEIQERSAALSDRATEVWSRPAD